MSTGIEWTDETWNPIRAIATYGDSEPRPNQLANSFGVIEVRGWHCERVSAGCVNCYAERINQQRFGTGLPYNRASRDRVEVVLDERTLRAPLSWRRSRRVFVCSMTDLFGEWVPDGYIDRVFAVMALAQRHTFIVLTKRPERMRAYISSRDSRPSWPGPIDNITHEMERLGNWTGEAFAVAEMASWPLPNVWLGVSVENQQVADTRIPELLATPAAVRWVSCEPLLGPVDLDGAGGWIAGLHPNGSDAGLDWVVAGGESGPGARPCNVEWIRGIVGQCQAADVPVFVKQYGSRPELRLGSQRSGGMVALRLRDRKGGNPLEWPEDLRVRQWPGGER